LPASPTPTACYGSSSNATPGAAAASRRTPSVRDGFADLRNNDDNLWDGQPPPLPPFIEDGACRLKEPMPAPKVTTHRAIEAYEAVLKQAGAFPRDAVTRQTIEEVRAGTGDYGRREPEGGLMAGLKPVEPPRDTDRDGMPDAWEQRHDLDPAKDDSAKVMPGGYTAIEVYLAEAADALVAGQNAR
jgi:hypothetical protein